MPLTSLLKTAKQNALNSTASQLEAKLQVAESNILNYGVGELDVESARNEISLKRSNEYRKAFNEYLQILFEAMSLNESNAIRTYFTSSVYVAGNKLICP